MVNKAYHNTAVFRLVYYVIMILLSFTVLYYYFLCVNMCACHVYSKGTLNSN